MRLHKYEFDLTRWLRRREIPGPAVRGTYRDIIRRLCTLNGLGHMTKMVVMPIYEKKNFKNNLLLRNQKAGDLEIWSASMGAQVLPSRSNDDPGLTLTYFTAMSSLVPYAFI